MKRAILAALICLLVVSPVSALTGDPRVDCTGYPEPRVFLETQDWWTPIPELGGTGHVHLGMCFPLGQTVSGKVHFDVRVLLHDNKGSLVQVKLQDDKSVTRFQVKPNLTPVDGGTYTYWFGVDVDTTKMSDGLRQFRWYAYLTHSNGNKQTARASWPLDIENGKTDSNVKGDAAKTKFQNWYQVASPARNWGYAGPVIDPAPIPAGSPSVNVKCTVNGDSGSPKITSMSIHVNPNVHAGDEGRVVYDGKPFSGNITIPNLVSGDKVMVRCRQVDGAEEHVGVGVVPVGG